MTSRGLTLNQLLDVMARVEFLAEQAAPWRGLIGRARFQESPFCDLGAGYVITDVMSDPRMAIYRDDGDEPPMMVVVINPITLNALRTQANQGLTWPIGDQELAAMLAWKYGGPR